MTVETKTWEVKVTEETMDALMAAYNQASLNYIHSGFDEEALNAYKALENALVALGMLEADEEPEEADEYDSETNWDEWMADMQYDAHRDEDLAMRYER